MEIEKLPLSSCTFLAFVACAVAPVSELGGRLTNEFRLVSASVTQGLKTSSWVGGDAWRVFRATVPHPDPEAKGGEATARGVVAR